MSRPTPFARAAPCRSCRRAIRRSRPAGLRARRTEWRARAGICDRRGQARRRTCSSPGRDRDSTPPPVARALATTARVNLFDETVELVICNEPGPSRSAVSAPMSMTPMPSCVSSTVSALRGRSRSRLQRRAVPREERVQHERRQREVVHPVHVARDLDLLLVVRMHLDEHLEPLTARPIGERADEVEGLGQHEAARPAFLIA